MTLLKQYEKYVFIKFQLFKYFLEVYLDVKQIIHLEKYSKNIKYMPMNNNDKMVFVLIIQTQELYLRT